MDKNLSIIGKHRDQKYLLVFIIMKVYLKNQEGEYKWNGEKPDLKIEKLFFEIF